MYLTADQQADWSAVLLPAPMIIKNYVEGDENCNYEKYLL